MPVYKAEFETTVIDLGVQDTIRTHRRVLIVRSENTSDGAQQVREEVHRAEEETDPITVPTLLTPQGEEKPIALFISSDGEAPVIKIEDYGEVIDIPMLPNVIYTIALGQRSNENEFYTQVAVINRQPTRRPTVPTPFNSKVTMGI